MAQPRPAPAPASGLRDNHSRGSVADFLREKIRVGADLSIVSAYFTIYAYDALKEPLERIEHLRFLFGEPTFVARLDPSKTEKKAFIIDSAGLKLHNKLEQKRVARECADWISRKVSIKTIRQSNLLHGKMYRVSGGGAEAAIIGSSNFTVRGLGLADAGNNLELNLQLDSDRDRADLRSWFDELWGDETRTLDVTDDVKRYLAQLYVNHSPEFIYYKTLFHVFEKHLGDAGKTDLEIGRTSLFETDTWKALFEFQKDGVKGAINKILRHNGCILADSVGLGKTYEALAVIKYFELKNERVLVLCPKRLADNWTVYRANSALNPFLEDRYRYDVLAHTDLTRDQGESLGIDLGTIMRGNYDLVVIDESHNFRNNAPGRYDDEGKLVRSRYRRLMDEVLKAGVQTKVLLLSATPVNNDLRDLRNQLYLLTADRDDAFADNLGISSLKDTLAAAQTIFTQWAKHPQKREIRELLNRLSGSFFTLLDELTIARSRRHLQRYYAGSIAQLGGFPKRLKPISIHSEIDTRERFPSYDKLNDEISGYTLSLFNPTEYVLEEFRDHYRRTSARDPFSQSVREGYLIAMMKVNFLKRLESSVKSFEITMERTIAKIEKLEKTIREFMKIAKPATGELAVETDGLLATEEEQDDEAREVGGRLKFQLRHLRLKDWLTALKKDKDQLCTLFNAARAVTPETDAKMQALKKLIAEKVKTPTTNKQGEPNRKVLVFTAFADTAGYLYDSLRDWARSDLGIHIARVCGGNENATTFGGRDYADILTNFAPRSKRRAQIVKMPQTGEIDLLIATDCISEGQNLQDCDYLINYDIHWNPVRIIQRFGRIDRIGSANDAVQLVNFWPTDDLNKYINLKNRVEARMALVDVAATADDNLLSGEGIEDLVGEDLRYRDRQLLRLKNEILDLEDLTEGASLTDFSLDDFRVELMKYIEANRAVLEAAPFGLYTVVPTNPAHRVIAPGVIFCFRHDASGTSGSADTVNPLRPYFLVYVLGDGNVRFSFAHPKQILDILRALCAGKCEPDRVLCDLFDTQTDNGARMADYTVLLGKAMQSISSTFRKRLAAGLQSGRDFVLPVAAEQVQSGADLELVTWLVIKQQP